jgi:UDP-N-acetylmuramyl pentapeptide phosphotransferase/UDP-N-acetylglucosamine-1-phosphate transferase
MTASGLWAAWCAATIFVAAALTRWLVSWTAERGIVDTPNARSSHTRATPRGGGLAIVGVVAAVAVVMMLLEPRVWRSVAGVILPALAIAAVSWVDDVRTLRNRTRFAVHLLAAVAAAAVLGPVTRVDLGSLGQLRFGPAAWPLTLLWIAGLTNAFNFMDGSDGIAGVTAAAAAAGIAAAAAALGAGSVAMLAASLAGGAIGFLSLNWPPARIFMGDVGSAFCGFLIAVLPLALPADCRAEVLPLAALAMWPFIFDTAFTFVRRLGRGENVFEAHRSHLYQRLLIGGWSHRGVACLYGGLAAFGAMVALTPLVDPATRSAADEVAVATLAATALLLPGLVIVTEKSRERHVR